MTAIRFGWRGLRLAGCIATAGVVAAGCVSAEPRDRPPPKQPEWAKASALLVSTSFPEDTDGNGYLDTIGLTAYIFDDQFPGASIQVPGAFNFALNAPDGAPLAAWDLTPQETEAIVRVMPPGPGYVVRLSLLEKGTDRTDFRSAELHTTFTPVSGKAVRAKSLTVTIGRSGLRPAGSP
ncbi:MAG: hypothetical protein IT436_05535 [Phycisphaerales bacterium]|nr:hypothetical protein [Phycisphaerales bacterium]